MRTRIVVGLAVAVLLLSSGIVRAEPLSTTIALKELDCPSCAKKLATKLLQVPGVAQVKTDLDAKTATVLPRPREQPSPRALWETVEKAGFEPVKLEGPAGKFSARPQ